MINEDNFVRYKILIPNSIELPNTCLYVAKCDFLTYSMILNVIKTFKREYVYLSL